MKCRHCNQSLEHVFLDLGFAPPSNAYLGVQNLNSPEVYYPLRLKVCDNCWLVQTEDYTVASQLFSSDYAYFSSTSLSWLDHSKRYVDAIIPKLGLNSSSLVIEVASNDGYLLKNFGNYKIPCIGIEPTKSTADAAEKLGISTIREFFGVQLAMKLKKEGTIADLIIGNNVYAHVPNINDFTEALKIALRPEGCITLEFPHLMRLLEFNQFDTVYHEHYSYLSLHTVKQIFAKAKLRIFDVEQISTHGGSLRVYACHSESGRKENESVRNVMNQETQMGLQELTTYTTFQQKANRVKDDFIDFLVQQKRNGKTVAAYGAAAKGNTLLNFGGIKPDLLPYVCDAAPSKQGKYLPGSHIPILSPEVLKKDKPDFVIVFPWNILDEVKDQIDFIKEWGARYVVSVPELKLI